MLLITISLLQELKEALNTGSSYYTVKGHFGDRSRFTMVISLLWDNQDVDEAVHKDF